MKNTIKGFSFLFLIFFVTLGVTACKNFVNAEEVREQIEKNIAYNNASSYKIHLESSISGVGSFKSPSTGVTEKKVTDVFTVSYDPIPEYAFIEWKVTDKITGNPADGYLAFEDVGAESTTCTFVKAPESGIELCLCAVVTTRPKELDHSPRWDSNGVNKDSRIQVRFSKPMDESSIYYDDNEISNIIDEKKITINDFLPEEVYPKYGYKKDGKQYWKNITIVDNASPENSLLDHFKNPAFEDPKTFVIQAKTTLTEGTELLVTLDKDFACKETGESTEKLVTFKESLEWFYLVNNGTDTQPPSITSSSITNSPNGDLSTLATNPTMLKGGKVTLNILASDGGSGPAGVFNLELENIATSQKKNVSVKYKSVIGTTAKYNDNYSFLIDDGSYKINKLIVSDRSGKINEKSYNSPYYITVDNTAPQIISCGAAPYGYRHSNKGKIKYTYTIREENLAGVRYKYKESGSSDSWDDITTTDISFTSSYSALYFDLENLEYGKTYDIYAEFYDKANNDSSAIILKDVETLPKPLNAASVNIERISQENKKDKFKISWVPPEGNYSGIYITGTGIDNVVLDSNGMHEYTMDNSNLSYNTEYTYAFYTTKGSGLSDVDRSATSVTKTIWTRPKAISLSDSLNVSLSYPRIVITTSNALSMKVYYKKSTEAEYGNPEIVTTSANINSTRTIGNLEPATSYDIKITRYNSTSGLESDPIYYKNKYTAPAKPENLQVATSSNTTKASALLTWTAPAGNYDSYTIEYSLYGSDSWTALQNISKAENSYTITGLDCLKKYQFRIKTVYKVPSTNTVLSSNYDTSDPVSTPPLQAVINCSFDNNYNVNVVWSLPVSSPYIDSGTTIKLCYGETEDIVKAETNSVTLEWIYSLLQYNPRPKNLTRSDINIYNKDCYFAIKTTCKDSSNTDVSSWSEVKTLFMPPDITPCQIEIYPDTDVSSDTIIVGVKNSGKTCDRVNLYIQAANSEETFVGYIQFTNQYSPTRVYYFITGLLPDTDYTVVAKTELNGFESIPQTKQVTTMPAITGDLNLRVEKSGSSLILLWNSNVINGKTINSHPIARVGVRYRKKDSERWEYWGGDPSGSSYNGYATSANTAPAQTFNSGTYIIELVTYYQVGSGFITTNKMLTTNSIEYTVQQFYGYRLTFYC